MSAAYIIKYAGAPLRVIGNQPELVTVEEATVFASEADAWTAAHQLQLPPNHVEVVHLDEAR